MRNRVNLGVLSWLGAIASAAVLWEMVYYISASDSNHTAFEPWLLVTLFIPTMGVGALAIVTKRGLFAGVLAVVIGASGLAAVVYVDRTNTMVQYERWLARGMPDAHEPSQPSDVR